MRKLIRITLWSLTCGLLGIVVYAILHVRVGSHPSEIAAKASHQLHTEATVASSQPSGIVAQATDYSNFVALSTNGKDHIIWELYNRHEWGLPEHKPICRDILANQGYHSANEILWTAEAINLAEKQGWTDLNPLIEKIYQAPRNIWIYERAFLYLRSQDGKPAPSNIGEDIETLRRAGYYRSSVTDGQLSEVIERLTRNHDKETVLVSALCVAHWPTGKGGSDRGRLAAVEVLQRLHREDVVNRLRQFHRDFDQMRPEVDWVARHLNVELGNDAQNQVPEDTAHKLADP